LAETLLEFGLFLCLVGRTFTKLDLLMTYYWLFIVLLFKLYLHFETSWLNECFVQIIKLRICVGMPLQWLSNNHVFLFAYPIESSNMYIFFYL